MASDELNQRAKDVYGNIRGLVAAWRKECKPNESMTTEIERLRKLIEGSLDGLLFLMDVEVPEDGT